MIEIILLFVLFAVKHFVADFVLQTASMVEEKGVYGRSGGLEHALIHAIGTFIVTFVIGCDPLDCVILALFDGVVHYHIDWAKQRFSQGLTMTDKKFWVWFGLDQLCHYLTYTLMIVLIVL